jgi:hypothetical protein
MKVCTICTGEFDDKSPDSVYGEAGEWLAEEVWRDAGELCPRCLESRAHLVMMYGHDVNR